MDGNPHTTGAREPSREFQTRSATTGNVSFRDPAVLVELWDFLELYHAVMETVVEADTPDDLERGICEAIVGRKGFDFACVGDTGDGNPSVRTTAGVRSDDAAAVVATARSHLGAVDESAGFATVDEEIVVDGVVRDYTLAVVPVGHNGTRLGALVVLTKREAFSPIERTVLASLARYLGYATVSLAREAKVTDDTLIELSVTIPAGESTTSCPLYSVATETESRLEYRGGVLTTAPQVVFLSVDGDLEQVADSLRGRRSVEEVRVLDDGCIEVTSEATLPARLSAIGAHVEAATFEPTETRAKLQFPDTTGAKRVLDRAVEICPGLTLTAKRRVRPDESGESRLATLPGTLTKRQREVLRTAYLAGFFDRPRETTGDEIAEMLDISSSTFHQHLRVALAKTLSAAFGDG